MLSDPLFYLVSVPAVMLYGIAKGGFGGPIPVLAVPLMALAMPPTQAAAILLPLLVVMDALVVKAYWGVFDGRALKFLLPGAMVGVLVGYLLADSMNEHYMRLMIGVLSLTFGVQSFFGLYSGGSREHTVGRGTIYGALGGFASFSIHAGGPPLTMYLMPKQMTPLLYAGTAGIFFAVVNTVKVVPYYVLGQFTAANLLYSLVLLPLAPLGVKVGHYLVQRSEPRLYYRVISVFLVVLGARLLYEGLAGL